MTTTITAVTDFTLQDLSAREEGHFSARFHCYMADGQQRGLRIEFSWFQGLPQIDIEHAELEGGPESGMAMAARHTDILHGILLDALETHAPMA